MYIIRNAWIVWNLQEVEGISDRNTKHVQYFLIGIATKLPKVLSDLIVISIGNTSIVSKEAIEKIVS